MITIRDALPRDRSELLAMSMRFLAETQYGELIEANHDSMQAFIEYITTHGKVFVAQTGTQIVGMLGVLLVQHPMSAKLEAGEAALWIEPAYRGGLTADRLIAAGEQWARQQGAGCIKMTAPVGSRVERLYARRGYRPIEVIHHKRL